MFITDKEFKDTIQLAHAALMWSTVRSTALACFLVGEVIFTVNSQHLLMLFPLVWIPIGITAHIKNKRAVTTRNAIFAAVKARGETRPC